MKKRGLTVYLAITFAVSWLTVLSLSFLPEVSPLLQTLVFAGVMFVPALSSLITRKITGEGFGDMRLRPNLRGSAGIYAAAWLGVPALIAAGGALYFFLIPSQFDPNMGYIAAQLTAAGAELPQNMAGAAAAQLIGAVVYAPVLNALPCLGEELGWRGYMLPKLTQRFSARKAVLISGVIWGLWHAPMIALGHNYGTGYTGFPWLGILAMVVFCVVMGVLFGWFSLITGSVWPAVIAHGALNGFASAPMMFLRTDAVISPFVGPAATGLIGGACFIAVAVWLTLFKLNRLPPFDELEENALRRALPKKTRVVLMNRTGSTNDEAKRLALNGAPHGTVVAAKTQTAGRGRQGKSFSSPAGGLYFTVILRMEKPAALITCAAGVAVAGVVQEYTDAKVGIKWVNDVFLDGKKLCGILSERVSVEKNCAVVGIGINFNAPAGGFTGALSDKATALFDDARKNTRRVTKIELCGSIVKRLLALLEQDERIINEYRSLSLALGRSVTYEKNGETFTVTALDIDSAGGLVVAGENGQITLTSGEVSIKL